MGKGGHEERTSGLGSDPLPQYALLGIVSAPRGLACREHLDIGSLLDTVLTPDRRRSPLTGPSWGADKLAADDDWLPGRDPHRTWLFRAFGAARLLTEKNILRCNDILLMKKCFR